MQTLEELSMFMIVSASVVLVNYNFNYIPFSMAVLKFS